MYSFFGEFQPLITIAILLGSHFALSCRTADKSKSASIATDVNSTGYDAGITVLYWAAPDPENSNQETVFRGVCPPDPQTNRPRATTKIYCQQDVRKLPIKDFNDLILKDLKEDYRLQTLSANELLNSIKSIEEKLQNPSYSQEHTTLQEALEAQRVDLEKAKATIKLINKQFDAYDRVKDYLRSPAVLTVSRGVANLGQNVDDIKPWLMRFARAFGDILGLPPTPGLSFIPPLAFNLDRFDIRSNHPFLVLKGDAQEIFSNNAMNLGLARSRQSVTEDAVVLTTGEPYRLTVMVNYKLPEAGSECSIVGNYGENALDYSVGRCSIARDGHGTFLTAVGFDGQTVAKKEIKGEKAVIGTFLVENARRYLLCSLGDQRIIVKKDVLAPKPKVIRPLFTGHKCELDDVVAVTPSEQEQIALDKVIFKRWIDDGTMKADEQIAAINRDAEERQRSYAEYNEYRLKPVQQNMSDINNQINEWNTKLRSHS